MGFTLGIYLVLNMYLTVCTKNRAAPPKADPIQGISDIKKQP